MSNYGKRIWYNIAGVAKGGVWDGVENRTRNEVSHESRIIIKRRFWNPLWVRVGSREWARLRARLGRGLT